MLLWNCVVCNNNKMIHETQQGHEQKYYLHTCSVQLYLTQSLLLFLCYSVILLLQQQNYMRNAKSSTTSGQLDICSQMYPAQMSYEESSSLSLVPLCCNTSD